MDRARGRFGSHSGSSSPREGPSRGGNGNGNGNGNGHRHRGDQPKRRRSTESDQGSQIKRQRSGPVHGKEDRRKRQPRYDLDITKPHENKTGHGTDAARGQQIVRLKANYFPLSNRSKFVVYLYHVDMEPDIDSTRMKKGIFYECTKDIRVRMFFTGTSLYTTEKLDEDVKIINGARRQRGNTDESSPVVIKIRYIKEITEFQDVEIFQVLNICMKGALNGLQLQLVGRNFFDAVASVPVHNLRVEVWPGYVTSIRQHDQGLLLCCETTSKVMRNETCYSIFRTCVEKQRDYKSAFINEVLGKTILTDYNNKTYRIDDVDFDQTPESTFETKNGPKSYMAYYAERYHITIRDPRQPLLISRERDSKKRNRAAANEQVEDKLIALVPELCRATGITDDMRANFQTMRTLGEVTRLQPNQRVERLIKFSRRINETEESRNSLRKLGMTLSTDLVSLEGRQLEKPKIFFDDAGQKYDRDFANSLRNRLYRQVNLENWVVISTERDRNSTRKFIEDLKRSNQNIRIQHPEHLTTQRDEVRQILEQLESAARRDPQLILVVVPNNQADRYQAIKKKCCIERAIPTQVVTARSLNGKNAMSIATKISIQMNCKIGGAPWGIKMPLTGLLTIGYDVSHDTKNKNLTFGALVATLDQFQSQFFSAVSQHDDGVQLSNTFTLDVIKAVRAYKELNNANPTKIIIYRDGVGDGQIRHVLDHEKAPLEKMLFELLGEDFPFTFVIVNKKTNTRLFASDPRSGGYGNPRQGTVVDTTITLPERYDFYLVPTSVRQGSISPVYYNVIYDKICLPPARLQMLTYFMCFGYYNWTDAIAVPAVCKYAGKLAFLCGQHLHSSPLTQQDKRLYFL